MDGDQAMERRTFMAMLTGGIVAPPFAVEAQQAAKVYRVGLLGEKVFRLESSWLGGSWGHIRAPEREARP